MHFLSLKWAGVFRRVFSLAAILAVAGQAGALAQSEFSAAYLNGKSFFTVDPGEDGKPLEAFALSFGAAEVTAQGIVPAEEAEVIPYSIDGGVLVVDTTRISIVSAETDFLQVRMEEEEGEMLARWYFEEAKAMAVLRTAPFLPGAWIMVDGNFEDWSDVLAFEDGGDAGDGQEILRYQYASDGDYLYFAFEAKGNLGDSGEQLHVSVNSAVEFGIDRDGNGWFYDGHTGQSFAAAGGEFVAEGNRLEGKLPLTLFGELPEFAVFKATLESDFGEDYADVLLQVDGRLPEGGAELFGIVKFRYFEQTGTSTPVLRAEGPFEFEMFIDARTVSSVAAARVEGPGGISLELSQDEGERYWGGGVEFADRSAMDGQFPDGDYTFVIEISGQGEKTADLQLAGDFPPPARFSNFTAAREIDSREDFTLSWTVFPGADADDFVVVGIEEVDGDTVFETDRLPGNAESLEIPARVLQPDREYSVWVMVASVVDTNLEAIADGEALAAFASETRVSVKTNPLPAPAGSWALAGMLVPDRMEGGRHPFDAVFEDWYDVEGPIRTDMDAAGVFSGQVDSRLEFASHGQFLVFDAGAAVPSEAGTINRSGDVVFSASDWTEATFGVRIPESATQADFAGLWHFVGLNAGTVLTKTVWDSDLEQVIEIVGHDMPIETDGSQSLLDVRRSATTLETLTLAVDANGNGDEANLLWMGNGELQLPGMDFPLLANASRDFAFGVGKTGEDQSLVIGVRSPDAADASWLEGQWRFQTIRISSLHRMFIHDETGAERWVAGNDDVSMVLPGERLGWLDLAGRIEGGIETISQERAESVGISANGSFVSDGNTWHLNRSGDILLTAWEDESGWTVEIGFKVTDVPMPTRNLVVQTAGSGWAELSPTQEERDRSWPIEARFLQGETAILRAEAMYGWHFAGWVGDVPEGREQDETLVLRMDRDRWVWANFVENSPGETVPWAPDADSDGDGMLDMFEHLLVDRDPSVADGGANPLRLERGPEGATLELAVWESFDWGWALEYSPDLRWWGSAPEELVTRSFENVNGRPAMRIFVRMPDAEGGFFRLRMFGQGD